jgi:bacillithiol biosynthesis cysteine-adding enzyme BshC
VGIPVFGSGLHLHSHSRIFSRNPTDTFNVTSVSTSSLDLTGWIDYRQLPLSSGGYSQLFFDYLYEFKEVERFFPHNFRDSQAFLNVMQAVDRRPIDRSTLVAVLNEQNKAFGSPEKTFEHIELLEKPTTYAVVTGQQVGLFGGPLYTLFKTITTIKLAERLKAKNPQCDFVPVFWVEGEDHDFPEMNNTAILDQESKIVPIEYLPGGVMPERNVGAVGEMVFDQTLEKTFTDLRNGLQSSEFKDELISRLRGCYASGKTFNQAFTEWLSFLFEDYGVVFLSANDPRLKRILSPLFVKEISEFPKTSQMVIAQSAELEESYHAQIKAKSINLFMFHKGGRYLIEPREHDYSLKGTRHFISKEEMMRIAQETPELLSPNVVLRPLAQDALLPTVAYVAGPSEVAYHAQLKPVYEHFDVTQPVVYPRASASVVEERIERVMEKFQIELSQIFEGTDTLHKMVIEQVSEVKLEEMFGSANRHLADALSELKFGLKEIDPTLLGALEREISVVYFMNKYGLEFPRWLTSELDIQGFKHQILTM